MPKKPIIKCFPPVDDTLPKKQSVRPAERILKPSEINKYDRSHKSNSL